MTAAIERRVADLARKHGITFFSGGIVAGLARRAEACGGAGAEGAFVDTGAFLVGMAKGFRVNRVVDGSLSAPSAAATAFDGALGAHRALTSRGGNRERLQNTPEALAWERARARLRRRPYWRGYSAGRRNVPWSLFKFKSRAALRGYCAGQAALERRIA